MKLEVSAKGVIFKGNSVLLVREAADYADGNQPGKWDVPGGRIKTDEPIRDGLKREVQEECGLTVEIARCIDAFDHFGPVNGEEEHIVGVHYLCNVVGSEEVNLSADHDEYAWVPFEELGNYELVSNLDVVITHARELV